MAELPPEARVVYDLLHGEIEDLFDRKLSSFADTLTKSINPSSTPCKPLTRRSSMSCATRSPSATPLLREQVLLRYHRSRPNQFRRHK
jgi:hypothetical protein